MIDFRNKSRYDASDLVELMRVLRGPEGCPWDREQTHKSIRRNLLEEAYEAASAIDEENSQELLEELGDILLQVIFHADIAKDNGRFNLDDVIDATCKKLLRRHPHVFGNINVSSGQESLDVWEDIKRSEKRHETVAEAMDSVARALPALWRAEKIQKKAGKVGFDWPDYTGALSALHSELSEMESAIETGDNETIYEELGDLLFSVVNTARFFNIDPEDALNTSCDKFTSRFKCLEEMATQQNKKLPDMTLDEMEILYQKSKLEK